MPDEKQIYKRMPAVPRKISEISPEKDIRIVVLGKVIDKPDGALIVDDGSATAEIITEQTANINDFVRIFSRVLPLEEGYELRAEIVQNMNALDMDLYRKVHG